MLNMKTRVIGQNLSIHMELRLINNKYRNTVVLRSVGYRALSAHAWRDG